MVGESSRDRRSPKSADEVEVLLTDAEDLISRVARQLVKSGITVDVDELEGYGRQGLVEAAQRFDPDQGGDFRRFAYFRVRGAMIDGMRKMGDWSRRGYERVNMLRAAQAVGEGRDVEDVSRMSAAEASQRLSKHMASIAGAMTVGIFATHAFEGDGTVVALDDSASTEDLVADNQMAMLVRKAVENLPPPEDEIIRRYYVAGERMDDIAADMGKSKSWVSRVHTKAIARLGARLRGPRG